MATAAVAASCLVLRGGGTWFGYVLAIIFISGMMVVFSYVASLAPNPLSDTNLWALPAGVVSIGFGLSRAHASFTGASPYRTCQGSHGGHMRALHRLYEPGTARLTILSIAYIFLALLATVKVVMSVNKALR